MKTFTRLLVLAPADPDFGDDLGGASGATSTVAKTETPNPDALRDAGATPPAAAASTETVDDDAETDEQRAEREAAEAAERKKNRRGPIPFERHKDILDKQRARAEAAEKALAEERASKQQAAQDSDHAKRQASIDRMREEYEDLLSDGKKLEARAVRQRADQAQKALDQEITEANTQAAVSRATEQLQYDTAREAVEAKYPVLNPDHEDFDQEQLNEVAEIFLGLTKLGRPRVAALQRAVKLIMRDTEETPQETKQPPSKQKTSTATDRAAAAKKTALDAALKSPPLPNSQSNAAGEPHKGLPKSREDFAKLSEAEQSALMGDEL